jgi:hypothetical protein
MLALRPRSVMLVNIALGIASLLLGAYILWQTSFPLFWLFLAIWIGVLTVGRYFVCRACPYYGQDCPTYGWGHLTRLMYRRVETRGFNSRAATIEFGVILGTDLLPVIAWGISFSGQIAEFGRTEHILTGAYLALAVAGLLVHQRAGCARCEVEECPFSGAAHEKRRRASVPL